MTIRPLSFAGFFLAALLPIGSPAEELVVREVGKSPDGQWSLISAIWTDAAWTGARIDLTLEHHGEVKFRKTIPPTDDARYVKISWAPSSNAVLVALNFKAGENWLLIKPGADRARSAYLKDAPVLKALFAQVPFREEIKSIAPVGRVPWSTVRWNDADECSMAFIYRGLGYEGTAQLRIATRQAKPVVDIRSILPRTDRELWNED